MKFRNKIRKLFIGILSFGMALSSVSLPTAVAAATDANKITDFELTASSSYSGNPISNAKNGNYNDFWETDWSNPSTTPSESKPATVTATFNKVTEVGKMRIVQRKGNNTVNGDPNGRFILATYNFLDEQGKNVIAPKEVRYCQNNEMPTDGDINIDVNASVKSIRIDIKKAYNVTATMAEIEFFKPTNAWYTAVEANTAQSGSEIEKAFDGNKDTLWHSAWSPNFEVKEDHPAVVTITRAATTPMAELRYTTRKNMGGAPNDGSQNGNILKMNVYTSTDKQDWKLLNSVEWDMSSGTKAVNLLGNSDKYIKLEILKGYAKNASAAEFEVIELTSKDQINTSLIKTVEDLGLSVANPKGWEVESVRTLLAALDTAKTAHQTGTVTELLNAMNNLDKAYTSLAVDKKPLLDKLQEARDLDLVGKNPSSVANLRVAIANAEKALNTVKTPLEVQFEVAQLQSAMTLSDEPEKDIQNVAGLKEIKRDNNFNEGWLFRETTTDSSNVKVDESQFTTVNLPHDFSIDNDFTVRGEAESGFLLGGTGWYRKHVVLPENISGKTIRLIFDGAYMDTTVFVNGQKVGENHNGYNQFAFDITKYLTCDGKTENVIAVQVINNLPSSRWYSGSGIYRDVTLQVTEPTHIEYLGNFVATPTVTAESATVKVETTLVGKQDNTTVETVLYNKEGQKVAQSNKVAASSNKVTAEFTVTNPTLWSTDAPYLYKAVTTVRNGETVVDQVEEKIGFKSIRFDRDRGLFINDQNIKLQGVCMHHDQGALGAATNYHAVYRQMKIMKDMGVNAIRVTHNPASEVLLDVCDELGLLVINEAFDHLYYSKNNNNNDFARWFRTAIGQNGPDGSTTSMTWGEYVAKQMVKVSRNHASILMYSVGNELLEGGSSDDGYITTVSNICDWFKAEDPYHKPTIGDNKAKGNEGRAVALCEAVHKKGGIVGFNYANDGQYNDLRRRHPDWILYGSETSSAFHSRDVYNTDFKDENRLLCTDYENETSRAGWGHSASTAWKYVEENAWNIGEFVWTGFDYIGEPTPWNGIGVGSVSGGLAAPRSSFFGIVETTGFAKDIYYLYQSLWNKDVRTLHMTDSYNENLVKSNGKVKIQVFTDADKVSLMLDGKEIATKTATTKASGAKSFDGRYYAEFFVDYKPGTLSVKAYDKSGDTFKEVKNTTGRNSVSTTSAAKKTSLSVDKDTIESDGYDLAYVTVDVVDKDNHFVATNNQQLYFTLEGEGRIVGVDNGNQSDTQSFRIDDPKRASRSTFNGKALVIIQSTKRAGDIKLHVKGVGLDDNVITIKSQSSSTSNELSAIELVSKYSTYVNKEVQLPATVTGIFENGSSKEVNVTWDTSKVDYSKAGIYNVTGKLDGYKATAKVTINVYNEFAGAQNYSTVINKGEKIILPENRKVYYEDGSVAGEFPVVWKYFDESKFEANDRYTIHGTILIAGTRIPVTAHVRVEEQLPESRNLARLESDMPTLAQSCVHTADNLNSLNNGVIVSTNAQQRWTDWAEQGVQKPWVSYTWENKYMISDVIAYIYQDGSSTVPREMELEIETLNDDGTWTKQQISYITPVAYNDGDGKTTINLKTPVKTNGIRLTIDKKRTNCFTGLTELEVFEYIPKAKPNTDATLTMMKWNGNLVENFDPNVESYEVTVKEMPNMKDLNIAVQNDRYSTFVLIRDEANHKIHAIVTAEDGTEKTYVLKFVQEITVNKSALEVAINDTPNKPANAYTQASWEAYTKALNEAKAVYESEKATQEAVNNAETTLKEAKAALVVKAIAPVYYSATLNDNVSLNVYYEITPETLADETAYIELSVKGNKEATRYMVKDLKANAKGLYKVSLPLFARQMNDEVSVTVHSANGDETYTYSITQYAQDVLDSKDASKEAKAAVEAMLDYGAMAQIYFDYEAKDLANTIVKNHAYKDVTAQLLSDYAASITGKMSGIAYGTTNLRLLSEITIRHHFVVSQDIQEKVNAKEIKFVLVDGDKETELTPTFYGGNKAYVEVANIYAKNLDKTYTVKVVNTKTNETITVNYSTFSYAKEALEQSSNEKLQNVVKAMVAYNKAAVAYQATLK